METAEVDLQMSDIVDRVLASIGLKMRALEREIHRGEIDIAQSRHELRRFISKSPLTGAINEMRIRERTAIFDQVWDQIDAFMGKVIESMRKIAPFEEYVKHSADTHENGTLDLLSTSHLLRPSSH